MFRLLLSICLYLCLLIFRSNPVHAQTPIGQWQEYLPWLPAVAVTVSNDKVYCATAAGLFSVIEGDITRYSKLNGLHDIGISTIGSNNDNVLIAYQNGNLDLLQQNNIYNIPDLLRKQVAADKTVFRIFFNNNNAYLCTGLGIVVINLNKQETADTWITGNAGAYTPVYALDIFNGYFYAATAEGVKRAPVTGSNLADFRSWVSVKQDTSQHIIQFDATLICCQGKNLYKLENDTWQLWYSSTNAITNIAVNGSQLLVCEKGIKVFNTEGAIINNIPAAAPLSVAASGEDIWIADAEQGLLHNDMPVSPNGPASIITGDMIFVNNNLWAASGNNNGYYTFNKGEWKQFKIANNIISLAQDGNGVYAGSLGEGLIKISADGSTKKYNNVSKVTGLTTDLSGNLWVADYGANYNLLMKKPDDTWLSFRSPYAQSYNAISQLLTDDNGQIWIVSPEGNGLFTYDPSKDKWKQFRTGAQQGNLPSNDVYCIAKDKNGGIWTGTSRGIAVINCDCDAYLPVIKQGNFAGYLFRDEQVNTIAVDGANRKWVGTLNGAWLVSEDGEKILEQFNTTNSPLPDNHIYMISIDPSTGEVYFATGKGLMSWRGTATESVVMKKDEVLVFPNPVPSSYGGTIAIRGLTQNALVKITDISGRLVFQTRTLGGQAIWNGTDYTGHRPQSGVYLVYVTSQTGEEHIVTKIVFIN